MRTVSIHLRSCLVCGLAGLFLTAIGTTQYATADSLDLELLRKAPQIRDYLYEHGFKNVGVLNFQVQYGEGPSTYGGALINKNIADRLENALIAVFDPERPINIIVGASDSAAKQNPLANYRTAEDRRKLFEAKYELPIPVADREVLADAFVTGKVWVNADDSGIVVSVLAFSKAQPDKLDRVVRIPREQGEFLAADNSMLVDLGHGLKGRIQGVKLGRGADDWEGATLEENKPDGAENNSQPAPASPGDVPIEFAIRYDKAAQELRHDPDGGPGAYVVDDPREGQEATFLVKNVSNERIGIVLTVNGVSTLYREEGSFQDMTRWILEPGKEYVINGYYQKDGKSFSPIVGLSDQESSAQLGDLALGEQAGLIHLHVFRNRPALLDNSELIASRGSLRRVPHQQVNADEPRTWADMQKNVLLAMQVRPARGMLFADDELREQTLSKAELRNAQWTDTIQVRYWTPAAAEDAPQSTAP